MKQGHNTTPGLFNHVKLKMQETRTTIYICRCSYKGTTFSPVILRPRMSVGPVWGSNPRPPAKQSGALPNELTRRQLLFEFLLFFLYYLNFEVLLGVKIALTLIIIRKRKIEGFMSSGSSVNSRFTHDVTEIQTTKLLILVRFYYLASH